MSDNDYVPRDNSKDPTPWAILCGIGELEPSQDGCGLVFLTYEQYLAQLRNPDYPWKCPQCGCCAEWDDDCQAVRPLEGVKLDVGDMTCTPAITAKATIVNGRHCLRSLTDGRCSFPHCACSEVQDEEGSEPPERELPGEEP